MKAKLISQMVYDSTLDFIHGMGHTIRRLIIEEKGSLLAIFVYRNNVVALANFSITDGWNELLSEVEVPDELVEKALALTNAQKELNVFKAELEELLSE